MPKNIVLFLKTLRLLKEEESGVGVASVSTKKANNDFYLKIKCGIPPEHMQPQSLNTFKKFWKKIEGYNIYLSKRPKKV